MHAHDNRGRFNDHLPPGDGLLDWERLCRDLARLNFRGGLILETAGTDAPSITVANARWGRSFLRKLARRIAIAEALIPRIPGFRLHPGEGLRRIVRVIVDHAVETIRQPGADPDLGVHAARFRRRWVA